ncbi:MAG: glycosyltransferase family 4 protein [candidate division NC10 bacterium]|nr:glycosyltransferase family 4 protein [candidate division NC10 bacterium]
MGEGVDQVRIVYLLEGTETWGGVKAVLEQANGLDRSGHRVIVLSKGPWPNWFPLRAEFRQVTAFSRDDIPEADFIIGTYWTTVAPAVAAGRGRAVHFCQGYEGDLYDDGVLRAEVERIYRLPPDLVPTPERCAALRAEIEATYRLPTLKVTVGPHLRALIESRFGQPCVEIGNGIDLTRFTPGPIRPQGELRRILVVGPWEWPVKGIPYALEGLRRLRDRRHHLRIVRASQTPQSGPEQAMGVVDEYHQGVAPYAMPDLYRDCDLLVGASTEAEGCGLTAIEAMACGVPCVLTAIPSYLSLGHAHDYAIFVPPRDPITTADAIDQILSDQARWERVRKAGLEVAAGYPVEAVVTRLERALLGHLKECATLDASHRR